MRRGKRSLFDPVVSTSELNSDFVSIMRRPGSGAAREMLDQVFQEFEDPDGNFLQQFQTTGFNARFFELYLFAFFMYSGFQVDRSHEKPDFLVRRNGIEVAIEATTANPSSSRLTSGRSSALSELTTAELIEYQKNEYPFASEALCSLNCRSGTGI